MPKGFPTYQRIDPITGRVTNEFEGSIIAEGITLPVGAGDADPEDSHRVQWERRADGVMIAQVYAAETGPGGKGVTFKRDYAYTDVIGGEAHSTFATRAPGPSGGAGYSSEVHIATGNPGGTPGSVVANAWTPTKGQSVTIVTSDGESDFERSGAFNNQGTPKRTVIASGYASAGGPGGGGVRTWGFWTPPGASADLSLTPYFDSGYFAFADTFAITLRGIRTDGYGEINMARADVAGGAWGINIGFYWMKRTYI